MTLNEGQCYSNWNHAVEFKCVYHHSNFETNQVFECSDTGQCYKFISYLNKSSINDNNPTGIGSTLKRGEEEGREWGMKSHKEGSLN